MIEYEEEWFSALMFQFEGSVAPRAVIFALPSALLGVLLILLDDWNPSFRENVGLLDLRFSQIWTATTGVIVLMLGFRVRQALSRFWEGTSLLHQMRGEWFDTVSNCVTFSILAKEKKPEQVWEFRHTIVRLMSLAHGSALEEIAGAKVHFDTIDVVGLHPKMLRHIKECNETYKFNKVEVLLHSVQSLIIQASADGVLTVPPPILSRVFQTISRGFVNLLNAKKITDTRFPFPFAQLISFLLIALGFLTPLMLSTLIFNKFLIAVFTFVPMFGMCCMNYIAIELENPFGLDPNDLPLHHFQTEMNSCLLLLLHHNTDIIASTGSHCIKDFATLYNQVHGITPNNAGTFRISSWTEEDFDASVEQEMTAVVEAPITRPAQEPDKAREEKPAPPEVKPPPRLEDKPASAAAVVEPFAAKKATLQPDVPLAAAGSVPPLAEAMVQPLISTGVPPPINGAAGITSEAAKELGGIFAAIDSQLPRMQGGPEVAKSLPMKPPNPDRPPCDRSPGGRAEVSSPRLTSFSRAESRDVWYNAEMMVAQGMHEFNLSMQRWTKMVDDQVLELDRNCQVLRKFNEKVSSMNSNLVEASTREV